MKIGLRRTLMEDKVKRFLRRIFHPLFCDGYKLVDGENTNLYYGHICKVCGAVVDMWR